MALRAYFYDRSGNAINDPERAAEYIENLNFDTNWPGGYGMLSGGIKRDPLAAWPVKIAHEVIIRDGGKIVYQGEIVPRTEIGENAQQVAIDARGFYHVLGDRRLRKRWIDNSPTDRMDWPSARRTTASQMNIDVTPFRNGVMMRGGYGDVIHNNGDDFWLRYIAPTGKYIRGVESDLAMRSGEGIKTSIYDVTNASEEAAFDDNSGAEQTQPLDQVPFSNSDCIVMDIRWTLSTAAPDSYDENDRSHIYDIIIYFHYDSGHTQYASPSYTGGEIVEDILLLAGSAISSDYDEIGDPGLVLNPFMTLNDDWEVVTRLVERIAAYGDASQNTWGLCVWDQTGTSDSLPKAVFEARDVSDWDYQVRLEDLQDFVDEPTLDQLWNNIIIKYTSTYGLTEFLTGDDDATLTDTDSVADYGERHSPPIDIGKGDTTRAQYIGQRVLDYHKDPLHKTAFSTSGEIRNKQGTPIPVAWVRAGDRIKIEDYKGGTIYFIRHTQYDDRSRTLRVEPDLPPDDIGILMSQLSMSSTSRAMIGLFI